MSHTSGQWKLGNDNNFWIPDTCIEAETEVGVVVICDFVHSSAIEENNNKNLIMAAPDLLEALEELTDLVQDWLEGIYLPDNFTLQSAKAAIAKARGNNG